MPFHHQKQKTTFGDVAAYAVAFLIGDFAIALTTFRGVLIGIGVLELIAMIWLILRATWNEVPKNLRKRLESL
ncbi:MAG TPA: hypothetical protein VNW25_04010 [Candidatus Sulfotelmatobacter sp.]|nr:hypothetical protein [Candidatus Sulfotelmatobacter sp.]